MCSASVTNGCQKVDPGAHCAPVSRGCCGSTRSCPNCRHWWVSPSSLRGRRGAASTMIQQRQHIQHIPRAPARASKDSLSPPAHSRLYPLLPTPHTHTHTYTHTHIHTLHVVSMSLPDFSSHNYSSKQPRGLKNFINELRQCHSQEDERTRVDTELGNIRLKFSNAAGLSSYQKKKYVVKSFAIVDTNMSNIHAVCYTLPSLAFTTCPFLPACQRSPVHPYTCTFLASHSTPHISLHSSLLTPHTQDTAGSCVTSTC